MFNILEILPKFSPIQIIDVGAMALGDEEERVCFP